jgi:hypothetical protein
MVRLKRSSTVLDKAARRAAGMKSINEILDFGNGLNLTEFDARIQTLQTHISSYNTMLSGLDEMAGRIKLLEQELSSFSEKMLMSAATRYGKDSLQYIQAGGNPRKRSKRRTTGTVTDSSATASSAEKASTNGKAAKATVN